MMNADLRYNVFAVELFAISGYAQTLLLLV